jgi:hypothetical protein
MPNNTYVAINTVTLASAASSATFTSIPQTYTDLILVCNVGSQTTNAFPYLQFNGDTGTNYSFSQLYSNGSGAYNSRVASTNQLFNSDVSMKQDAISANNTYHIMNYSNTTTFKTALSRQNTVNAADYNGALAAVGVWRNTAAITSIAVKATRGGTAYNFMAGSTFTLYGVAADTNSTPKATGGYIYSDANYWYHVFASSSSFVSNQSLTADVLVVAGGGGSSGDDGGAGGAGGLCTQTGRSITAGSYTVTIGAGGASNSANARGGSGGNSVFDTITALGGGGGGYGNPSSGATTGAAGGSGGGGGYGGSAAGGGTTQSTSGGASGYGYAGGSGNGSAQYGTGGGGGAGGAGGNGSSTNGGAGGIGRTDSFINAIGAISTFGEYYSGNYYFAGGGGGSVGAGAQSGYWGLGGAGGGGRGGGSASLGTEVGARNGLPNTGGGAGADTKSGGSGIVVVRYAK